MSSKHVWLNTFRFSDLILILLIVPIKFFQPALSTEQWNMAATLIHIYQWRVFLKTILTWGCNAQTSVTYQTRLNDSYAKNIKFY